jgi:hypothetical protein
MLQTEAEREKRAIIFRRFLKDPDFIFTMKEIKEDYGKRIMGETDKDKREDLWHEARALDRLGGKMMEYVSLVNIAETERENNG